MTLVVALGAWGCGSDSTSGGSGGDGDTGNASADADAGADTSNDTGPPERQSPAGVDTVVEPSTVQVGTVFGVTCEYVDADGNRLDNPTAEALAAEPRLVYSPTGSLLDDGPTSLLPIIAGQATVACSVPDLALVDPTPVELTIEPGPVHTLVTELSSKTTTAGESIEATCTAFDAYGNLVADADTTVELDASGAGIGIDDHTITIEQAGIYTASCAAPGAVEVIGDDFEVQPGLPANLALSKVPDQPFYDTGQVITVASIVSDKYDNVVHDAFVDKVSTPSGQSFGQGRFRYSQEGTYTVTATVTGPTEGDVTLTDSVEIVVNGVGPAIDCISPADGAMLDQAPGSTVTFTGRVDDAQGVSSVTVNGDAVTVASDGTFSYELTQTYFGINYIDIAATDAAGAEHAEQNSTTCAFLIAEQWGAERGYLDDSVSLRLDQDAVDDRTENDGIDSLNDILETVLNSSGLQQQIHSALLGSNPLVDDCYNLLVVCAGYRIIYKNSAIAGRNDTELTLINDGLNLDAIVRGIDVWIDAETDVGDFRNIRVHVDWVQGNLDAGLSLANGKPTATVDPNSVQISSGSISLHNLTGVGWLDSIISSLAEGTIRGAVEDAIEGYLRNDFNATLNDLLGGLDIGSLGQSFSVPKLDGSGDLVLNFSPRFSTIGVDTSRALFGLGTRFRSEQNVATPSRGVPVPLGQVLVDPQTNMAVAAGIHIGVINDVLHTLWRAGYFNSDVGASLGSDFPAGTQAVLRMGLPPVAALSGGSKMKLMLGSVSLSLVYPGLFDDPIRVKLGAVATTSVALNGDELSFSAIQIQELYFSPIDVTLDADSRDVLEGFLRDLIQSLINSSLNGALPALPIPSFTLPQSMAAYGLPAGSQLGLVNPALSGTNRHFILEAAFGVR